MRLEDYIDIQGPLQIRVKGHRIGIEIITRRAIRKPIKARDEHLS